MKTGSKRTFIFFSLIDQGIKQPLYNPSDSWKNLKDLRLATLQTHIHKCQIPKKYGNMRLCYGHGIMEFIWDQNSVIRIAI